MIASTPPPSQANTRKPTTFVLVNMGGPTSLASVKNFLWNLFNDPDIISLPGGRLGRMMLASLIIAARLRKVRRAYAQIGGKSPLIPIALQQAHKMEEELKRQTKDFVCDVRVAMRYWHPFIDDVIRAVPDQNQLVFLSMYPHRSRVTTGSAFGHIRRVLAAKPRKADVFYVEDYHDHPDFIESWALHIQPYLEQAASQPFPFQLFFTAHNVPEKLIMQGDPYQNQIERSVRRIVERLGSEVSYSLSYQSRVGFARWLSPDNSEAIRCAVECGMGTLVVIPISFTADNLETCEELGIRLRREAQTAGIENFILVPALNTSTLFIKMLCKLGMSYVTK